VAKLSRDRIVSAARQALVDGGHERVALRALARDLGVTAPALYDHFDSKDALLRSVAEDGFFALIEAIEVDGERAIDRIRQRALAYIGFASENAELFRLMFLFRPAAVDLVNEHGQAIDNELGVATEAFERGAVDLAVAIADGHMVERNTAELAMLMWSTTHGIAMLALTAPTVAASVAEDVIDTILAGLKP
jgi:AcrR family transcriptional regulator